METKGQIKVEHSLVLPTHDLENATQLQTLESGTIIYNIDNGRPAIRSGSEWKQIAFTDDGGPPQSGNAERSMPVVFNDVLPSNTIVYQFIVNAPMLFAMVTEAQSLNLASLTTAPSGGPLICKVMKFDPNTEARTEIGRLTVLEGFTGGSVTIFTNTIFSVYDRFELETGVVNGAEGLSINFRFAEISGFPF